MRQLITGARKFDLAQAGCGPDRDDLVALTRDAAERSGISFITELDAEKADAIVADALK